MSSKKSVLKSMIFATVLVFLMVGCTAKKRSALDIYDAQGNRLAGATDTFEFTQVYPYQYNDVFDTAYKVLFRNGFQIEREDRNSGIIQGTALRTHIFSGGSNTVPFTASVIVKEVSAEPRTRINMVLDTHWGIFYDSLTVKLEPPSKKLGPALVAEIQKILSTF